MKLVREKKMAQTTKMTIISFLLLIIIGGFLLDLPISNNPGQAHTLLDSFFTATASVCVAGASTVVIAEQYTLVGKIIILALIQIGAMGFIFVVSSIMLFAKRKISFKNQINIGTILRNTRKT